MNKEEALRDFLKGLRATLNNASAYPKDHPYFRKSAEDFKQKVDTLLTFLNPIKLNIALDSLFLDGRYWEKQLLYKELASIFHLRKIKTIEFEAGLSVEELIAFLAQISLPIKEFLKQGGIKNILTPGRNQHLYIEELDYSQLLHSEGEESKDVWLFLFKRALNNNDAGKIGEIAEGFEKNIFRLQAQDLFEDEELRQDLQRFLMFLKDSQTEKLYKCSKAVLNAALKHRDFLRQENIDKLKELFTGFNIDDLAGMLWEEISTNDNFDILSFKLFSQISGGEKEKDIASSLLNTVIKNKSLKEGSKAVKKIENLLSTSDNQAISDVYRNTLSSLLKETSLDKGSSFDRELLRINYRFIILGLLDEEKNKQRLNLIVETASKELEKVIAERDFEYLKYLSDIFKIRKKEDPSLIGTFEGLETSVSKFIEDLVWEENAPPDLEYFMDSLEKPSWDVNFYLNKIFVENKATLCGLKLFFRFFPTQPPLFYKNLKRAYSNIELLEKIIKILTVLKSPLSKQLLEYIFSFANEFIKIDALKAIGQMQDFDGEFFLSVLRRGSFSLKKEALAILAKDDKTKKSAIAEFLTLHWKTNKLILQNLMVVEELELKEASDYLVRLSRRPFFFNRNLRKKAQEILVKWDVRKS